MNRLNATSEQETYEAPMLFDLDELDYYLQTLNEFLRKEIKETKELQPSKILSEEGWNRDGWVDAHTIDLGGYQQILIESALVAYYSYFERKLCSLCKSINSDFNLKTAKGNCDIDKYRKSILTNLFIPNNEALQNEWNKLMKFHLMRKYIVHANIKEADKVNILLEAKNNELIWFNAKTKDFSISIEYVKDFSKSISSFLSELDHQLFLKASPYRL